MSAQKPIVIIGASGHAKVVADIIERQGLWTILGFIDANAASAPIGNYRVVGNDDAAIAMWKSGTIGGAVVGVGDNARRKKIVNRILAAAPSFQFVSAVHPAAAIAPGVRIGSGSVVMAGAVINSGSVIGDHCIVNTRSSLDHDGVMNDFSSLAPGAVTGGNVTIGLCAAVSLGANVVQGVAIGDYAVLGAGALALSDVPAHAVAYGVPARVVRRMGPDTSMV